MVVRWGYQNSLVKATACIVIIVTLGFCLFVFREFSVYLEKHANVNGG